MLYLYFEDIYLFLPFLLNFIIFWFFFFKINFFWVRNSSLSTDVLSKSSPNYTFHNSYMIFLNKLFLLFLAFYLYILKGSSISFWWQHFKVSNLSLFIILTLIIINYVFLMVAKNVSLLNNFVKSDYIFALMNLNNFMPVIFLTNTLFTFLFILELVSVIVFYKFVVSKVWSIKDNSNVNNFLLFRNLPNYYLNMMFFQYWSTFFSSVLIVFSLISYIYLYSSTEWFVINLLNNLTLQSNSLYINKLNSLVLIFVLIFAFLIKIGFTPVHLYKIEIYKGLPFFAIFFYTTYYFLVFFLFFILFILIYFSTFSVYWFYILAFIVIISFIFIASLLFGLNYLKSFFAYSSVVNSMAFVSIIIALLNN